MAYEMLQDKSDNDKTISKLKAILENNEVGTIIASLRAGIGRQFKLEKLRYHKVITMADVDVDGSHIRT